MPPWCGVSALVKAFNRKIVAPAAFFVAFVFAAQSGVLVVHRGLHAGQELSRASQCDSWGIRDAGCDLCAALGAPTESGPLFVPSQPIQEAHLLDSAPPVQDPAAVVLTGALARAPPTNA